MTEQADAAAGAVGAPRPWRGRDRLTASERRIVALASAAPSAVVLLVLVPFAATGRATLAEVITAAAVHGALLGLAAGFVTVDRLQARQCPGCATRSPRGEPTCPTCGYDLVARPRWVCDQRHDVHIDPGLCPCGRRLQPLPPGRGVGREIVVMLKIGAWLLAFLMGMGVLLRVVG